MDCTHVDFHFFNKYLMTFLLYNIQEIQVHRLRLSTTYKFIVAIHTYTALTYTELLLKHCCQHRTYI